MAENNSDKLKGLREDYRKVFESEEGKRVLKHLEINCFYNSSVFDKDSLNTAYNCGVRDVYLSILRIMNMDIEELERFAKVQEGLK